MAYLVILNQREVKAVHFKKGRKYAYVGHSGPSEIGYVKLVDTDKDGCRHYQYKGIKTGVAERCTPSPNGRFLEVKVCT